MLLLIGGRLNVIGHNDDFYRYFGESSMVKLAMPTLPSAWVWSPAF
jgi:hypothetical protein